MISKLTRENLLVLDQVRPEFHAIIDVELKAIFERMVAQKDTADLHELRGRAKALQELQQSMRDARQTLVKLGPTPR